VEVAGWRRGGRKSGGEEDKWRSRGKGEKWRRRSGEVKERRRREK
jgi:hypothetical protein